MALAALNSQPINTSLAALNSQPINTDLSCTQQSTN